MIDAQLTTEIFGLLSPARPDIALQMAHLPIRTTAKYDAEWISEFYVIMHSLASAVDDSLLIEKKIVWLAREARKCLPDSAYSAKMYDFIEASYKANLDKNDWGKTRDEVYQRYQKNSTDGYSYQQPFDAGINFAASLISLFYGAETCRVRYRLVHWQAGIQIIQLQLGEDYWVFYWATVSYTHLTLPTKA